MSYELNKIYNEDSYEAIKKMPDKSVDCIYTDIPYLYETGGGGSSQLAKRIRGTHDNLVENDIADGIDMDILHDFVRISKKINIYIWCSKLQLLDIMNWFNDNTDVFMEIIVWGKTNPTQIGRAHV